MQKFIDYGSVIMTENMCIDMIRHTQAEVTKETSDLPTAIVNNHMVSVHTCRVRHQLR